MINISEHRFLIETEIGGRFYGKGLLVQTEKLADFGGAQKRHGNLAVELGMKNPIGGVASFVTGWTLDGFVRASSTVRGATDSQMWSAYRVGGVRLIEDELKNMDSE